MSRIGKLPIPVPNGTTVTVEGNKVGLRQFVHARISEEKKQEAFTWLRSIGEGDIIKNDVTVSFNSGQDNVAKSVLEDSGKKLGKLASKLSAAA